jgi:predicted NAD/FAD-dependent oxidoreductase
MRVGIVGAGLSGLIAGRRLHDAGHDVILWDKGRSPGGRLATRRIGDAQLDHGAQFFTVRDDAFGEQVAAWQRDGVVFEWCRGFASPAGHTPPDGYPRYAAHGGMNAIAKHLAQGLDVRTSSLVFSIHRGAGAHPWEVRLDDATVTGLDALIVTCPVPQTYSLLVSADIDLPQPLLRGGYDMTLCLLATLDGDSAVPEPGGVQHDPNFTFVADNRRKGISAVSAITAHASPAWSEAHWDDDPDVALAALVELAAPYIGDATIVEQQLKRWRFATPRTIWPDPCWSPDELPTVIAAGDAFAGPRMEGAALSGLAAAAQLLDLP